MSTGLYMRSTKRRIILLYFRKEKAEGRLLDSLEVKDILDVNPTVTCLYHWKN